MDAAAFDVKCERKDDKHLQFNRIKDVSRSEFREIKIKGSVNTAKVYYVRNLKTPNQIVTTMMDTGSNFNLSSCKEDFSYLEPVPSIKITAVDGEINDGKASGFSGKLLPNNLGIADGVYFPQLGKGCRIVLGYSLIEAGWNIFLTKTVPVG